MKMDREQLEALGSWRSHLLRCALLAALPVWAFHTLWRPSVPSYSRWGWIEFFGILSLVAIGRAFQAWRALRRISR